MTDNIGTMTDEEFVALSGLADNHPRLFMILANAVEMAGRMSQHDDRLEENERRILDIEDRIRTIAWSMAVLSTYASGGAVNATDLRAAIHIAESLAEKCRVIYTPPKHGALVA